MQTTVPVATPVVAHETAFVLPADVLLVAVAELAPAQRDQFEHQPGDVAIMRPGLRRACRLVSADMAQLVATFRTPQRLSDAVLGFARVQQRDPAEVLDASFEALQALVNTRVLVPSDAADASGIGPMFAPGQGVDGHEIVRPIQVLEDAELYQARRADGYLVALKVLRPGFTPEKAASIEREAAILRHLDGTCSPRFIAAGQVDGRPWLAAAWRDGEKFSAHAETLRAQRGRSRRAALHRLGCEVVRAYWQLHQAGVVHADVHAGNLLVDSDGAVTIVDFGQSRLLDAASPWMHADRASVVWFYEPEAAVQMLASGVPGEATFAGEQVALATLIYHLHTGGWPVEARAETPAVLEQIAQGRWLPFTARGTPAWPALEAVLFVAMQPDPAHRFPTTAAFLDALEAVHVDRPEDSVRWSALAATPQRADPPTLVDTMIDRVGPQGPLWSHGLAQGPTASLSYGAAGIAWFLYRAAQVRADPALLGLADAWVQRAEDDTSASAFNDHGLDVTPARVGATSPYHAAAGVHGVRGLLCHAGGDLAGQADSVEAFLRHSQPLSSNPDLTIGIAGQLVAAALLLDTVAPPLHGGADRGATSRARLVHFVEDAFIAINRFLGQRRRLLEVPEFAQLGIAHGWAGLLYAVLRASRAAQLPVPPWAGTFLEQLARQGRRLGQGMAWPTWFGEDEATSGPLDLAPGWCRGSAGQVHLWTMAHDVIGGERYLELASRAGWHACDHPSRSADLCCGLAGRAFALLALYRHTGEQAWLGCAQALAARAAKAPDSAFKRPYSLYRGRLGVATLLCELERPERAVMPFFAAEGWTRGTPPR